MLKNDSTILHSQLNCNVKPDTPFKLVIQPVCQFNNASEGCVLETFLGRRNNNQTIKTAGVALPTVALKGLCSYFVNVQGYIL